MSQTLPPQLTSLESDVIRLAPFGVIVLDDQGIIRFANPRAEVLFGQGGKADFSISGMYLNSLVSEIDYRKTKPGEIVHVLPELGQRPALVVRCEKLKTGSGQWTVFYLSEAEQRHERELVLEKEASTDELSGLANRRAFQRTMEANQYKALSIALIDIDFFKSVNDIHGHLKGDDVIRHVSEILNDCFVDQSILVSRMGGDEFSVLFDISDEARLVKLLDAFRRTVCQSKVPGSVDINVSTSIGAVISKCSNVGIRDLLTEADRQLYEAKAAGRNCVFHAVWDSKPGN